MVRKQTTMKKKPSGGGGPTTSPSPLAATTTTSRNADDAPPSPLPSLSIPQQQRLLNHFAAAFASALSDANLPQRLQAIKQALYRRDFAAAFGREDHLAAYAARWSPTRALCYAAVFQHHLAPHLDSSSSTSSSSLSQSSAATTTKMICVGGCAAEHVAFASYLAHHHHHQQQQQQQHPARGSLTLLDSAPWAGVASTMQATLTTPLPLSKHASAAAANAPPLLSTPAHLRLRVLQQDALELTETQWADVMTANDDEDAAAAAVVVVTLLFTLNELYTSGGVGKTTRFLGALEAALPDGALLLVVDSPGSYSEAAVGKDRKKYPMQWLLHHTLTGRAGAREREWTRLESHDSLWFRLSDQLTYPIQLENMRYQLHLYRIDRKSPT
ncbi:Hypothetical protein BBA_06077 [Beauveria bassiana ARSEF 2860]|uniref:25S rRNA (Uridine(2843)-N(3))-methyltransferase n=1 Tax=Beauveria bassiana (strain ARSEF 2860) TaxID=655819 RepID=J4UKS1_BEAB2|nr:Hypothetical protein BBA_06077 [Beauveria bassiana ARSEF 2860]EJP64902.1 Hypothetical protein BBA_06077 [Beauveria bassiana ARSEF 2860]